MMSMYKLNTAGDNELPCRTPLITENGKYRQLFQRTAANNNCEHVLHTTTSSTTGSERPASNSVLNILND